MVPRLTVRLFSDIHGDLVGRTVSPYPDCRGAWLLLFGTPKARVLDADPANDRVAEDWLNICTGPTHPVVW